MSKTCLRRMKSLPALAAEPSVRDPTKRDRTMRDLAFVGYIAFIMLMAFKRPFLFTLVYAYIDIRRRQVTILGGSIVILDPTSVKNMVARRY